MKWFRRLSAVVFKLKPSDKEFPKLFSLFGGLWLRHDSSGKRDFNDAYSAASVDRKPWKIFNV